MCLLEKNKQVNYGVVLQFHKKNSVKPIIKSSHSVCRYKEYICPKEKCTPPE